jgi:hypothetical protein
MSNDGPTNLHLVCPEHGRQDVASYNLTHYSTRDTLISFQGNRALHDQLTERRKTPVAECERYPCRRTFTNMPMSSRFDIEVMIELADDDDHDSEEEQTYHNVDYYTRFVPVTGTF